MEDNRVQYIRRNGRKKGRKKGVLFCGIDPEDNQSVMIGFTLCHTIDRFDYVGGVRQEGFGVEIARTRAEKWKFHTDYFVQKTYREDEIELGLDGEMDLFRYENPDKQTVVEIPPSVMAKMKGFIERCKRYYKDKDFPVWTEKILLDTPIDKNLLVKVRLNAFIIDKEC